MSRTDTYGAQVRVSRCFLLAFVLLLLTTPCLAQDIGTPDTVRYAPVSSTWTIDTEDDTLHSVALWAWCDDLNVLQASLGFRVTTSTGGGTGHDDSLIIVDTFVCSMSPQLYVYKRSVLDSLSFPDASHSQFNGYVIALINLFGSLFPPSTPTKIGDLTLRILDPTQLPQSFGIVVDSSFHPVNSPFAFYPSMGSDFPPQFLQATINVINNLGTVPPEIDLSPTLFQFDAIEGGTNPASQMLSIINSGGGTLEWTASDDAGWLMLSPASGSGDGFPTLYVDISGLSAGIHDATITVSDPDATNDPQFASVTLTISPPPPEIMLNPTSFTFDAVEGGSNPASQMLSIINSGGGTLEWTASDDASWLTLSPASGSGDGSTTLYVDITGLSAGIHDATITVSDPDASNSPQYASVTLTISPPPPEIDLSPISFQFDAIEGGTNPASQMLNISNSGGGTLEWTASDDAGWLTLSPASGLGDGSTTLYVDITGLSAGIHDATITVSDPDATNDPQFASVTLTIEAPPPEIMLNPTSFTFDAIEGESDPPSQMLSISNSGGGTLEWTASDDAGWLTLSPASGSGDGSTTLYVDITGLSAGIYDATITVSDPDASNSPQYAAVTLTIETPVPIIELSPTSFSFSGFTVGANPASQTLNITNGGDGTLNWSATDDAAWLTLNPASGTGDGSTSVQVNTSGLSAGVYSATITVSDPAASNSPQQAAVTLEIADPPPVMELDQRFLLFLKEKSGPDPPSQSMNITNAGGQTLNWSATKTNSWLTLSANSGTAPSAIIVGISGAPSTVDTYRDTIIFTSNGLNSPEISIVELVVYSGQSFPWGDADCSGFVDIDDVVYLINYIFASGPAPGDPDGDGEPDCP